MSYRVAVVGATGNVGREMLQTLAEREFPGQGSDRGGLRPARPGSEVSYRRGRRPEGPRSRQLRFQGRRHRAVLAGRQGLGGACAARRRGRLHRHRQHLAVPHGSRRAAGRAGGQSRGDRPLQEAQHHRQSQLLDHPDGGGAEAAARSRADQARRRGHLSVGLRRRQGGDGRALQPDPRHLRQCIRSSASASPSRSPSTASPISTSSCPTARPRRNGRWRSRRARSSIPTSRSRATCVRVPVFIGHAEAVNVEFEKPDHESEALRALRGGAGHHRHRPSRRRGLCHARWNAPARMRSSSAACAAIRRVAARLSTLDRLRQSAQGRGAQRRADRRASGEARAGDLSAKPRSHFLPSFPRKRESRATSEVLLALDPRFRGDDGLRDGYQSGSSSSMRLPKGSSV